MGQGDVFIAGVDNTPFSSVGQGDVFIAGVDNTPFSSVGQGDVFIAGVDFSIEVLHFVVVVL